jgi:DNA-binding response OmpR family regulator
MKVLIIDDDTNVVNIWTIALKQDKFDVITAANGRDGVSTAKREKPDFILLDEILPDIKGNDVLALLKEDPETQSIPVALLSNYSENQLMHDAIQKGAVDYILKYQIEPVDLVNKIKTLTGQQDPSNQPA